MPSLIEQDQISELKEQLQAKDELLQTTRKMVQAMGRELETLKSKTGTYLTV